MSPSDQHVQYVLLAEFDIDKGASLKYQLPGETGTDEHILSELMLPDGAHLRAEDWTIFCLNQKIPDPDADHNNATAREEEREKPLLYVLNLVRTKLDATARRGAHVKSMAICTRHQFLHIYKPVLLLAMEKYFENPSREILESLYRAVNDMDLSRMPRLSWHERQILRSTDDKTMFEELFIDDDEKATSASPSITESWMPDGPEEYEGLRQRRGTLIDLTSGSRVLNSVGKDRHFYETKIDYEGIKLPIRVPLTVNNEEVGDFSLINLIRTFSPPPSQPGSPNPHHPHLDSPGTHTHPIILLLNALLTQKRIVFLGYGHPSGEVANYVLAACALGSGCGTVLRGFTERAFPYTNLTSVDDLLKCPGFIAGVTNPTYEEHTAWWDVLCNISTGKITVSKDIQLNYGRQSSVSSPPIDADSASFASLSISRGSSAANFSKERDMDTEFMNDVMNAIQSHYGETAIRAKFQDYVARFVRLAALYEEDVYQQTKIGWEIDSSSDPTGLLGQGSVFPDEATRQRELSSNASRIEGWRQTISYRYYQKDFTIWKQNSRLKNLDVYRQICKLKILRDIPDAEIIAILDAFRRTLISDQHIIEFLSFLPQHQGGLSPLGLCLFHSSPKIRHAAVQLFNKISTNPTGMKFIQSMSKFQRMAYDRQCWLDASNGDSSIYSQNSPVYPM